MIQNKNHVSILSQVLNHHYLEGWVGRILKNTGMKLGAQENEHFIDNTWQKQQLFSVVINRGLTWVYQTQNHTEIEQNGTEGDDGAEFCYNPE